ESAPGREAFHAIRPLRQACCRISGMAVHRVIRRKIAGDPGMTRTCDLRFRKPPLYPAELRDRAHRRQAPTDCGFLAGPGFNRHPCGRVEMPSVIRPDLRIGLSRPGRNGAAKRNRGVQSMIESISAITLATHEMP